MKEKGVIVTCDPDYMRGTIRAHHVEMHVSLHVLKGKTSPTVWDTGFSLIDKCPTPSLLSVKPESVSHGESL